MIKNIHPIAIALILVSHAPLCVAETHPEPGLWSGAPRPFVEPDAISKQPRIDLNEGPTGAVPIDAVRAGNPEPGLERIDTVKAATVGSAAATLAALDESKRNNALIRLEPMGAAVASWPLPNTMEIARWWNQGEHERALLALEEIEAAGIRCAPAISWKEPLVSHQKMWYQDVRIGDPRQDADDVIVDYHALEGTIFAAVSWSDGWSMNISTDLGASWQETFWFGSPAMIGMAVAGDHAWVAYNLSSTPGEARMRRFYAGTGNPDDVYFWESIDEVDPAAIVDLELGSNQDDYQNRIFPILITDTGDFRFYWSDLTGTAFTEMSPPVVNASGGLDFTWNTHDSLFSVYISYINNVDNVIVWRIDSFGDWDPVTFTAFTGIHKQTGISAFMGTVMVIHEHLFTEGIGARYEVSYDNGTTWGAGSIYIPGPGEPGGYSPDISLRSGSGSAAVFNREEGAFDLVYVTSRRGYSPGSWSDPLAFNNFDLMSGSMNQIDWIGIGCVSSFGMVYMGEDYIPYFDLTTSRGFFCDGFESGDDSAWD